jgi:hypothetical protein
MVFPVEAAGVDGGAEEAGAGAGAHVQAEAAGHDRQQVSPSTGVHP